MNSGHRIAALMLVGLLLDAGPASANGADIGNTRATARGGVIPMQNHKIKLVTEKLRIRVGQLTESPSQMAEDNGSKTPKRGNRYTVHATYTLSNPTSTKLVYGVPLIAADLKAARATGRSVRIQVGGRTYRCDVGKTTKKLSMSSMSTRYKEMFKTIKKKGFEGFPAFFTNYAAWCAAEIKIPAGKAVKLQLRYQGELLFMDFETAYCAWDDVSRLLSYPLSPAGYWSGNLKRFDAEIDLGPHGEFTHVVGPRGYERKGTKIRWRLRDVDLKKTADIQVVYTLNPVFKFAGMAGFNNPKLMLPFGTTKKLYDAGLDVRASSTLPAAALRKKSANKKSANKKSASKKSASKRQARRRFNASNVTDGVPGTVWCQGKAGVGQWLEVRLRGHPYSYTYYYQEWRGKLRPLDVSEDKPIKGSAKKPAIRLLHDSPSKRWPDVEPSFIVVQGDGRDRKTFLANNRVRKLRVSLCGESKVHADVTLPRVTAHDQSAFQIVLEGELLKSYRAALGTWHRKLRKLALPCARRCIARRIKRCARARLGPAPCIFKVQQPCEMKCFKRATRRALKRLGASASGPRSPLPCLRFTILEIEQGRGRHRRTCLGEIAPNFRTCR